MQFLFILMAFKNSKYPSVYHIGYKLFKMGEGQGGAGGGADRDSKWWLSIDHCTKCHFIWGAQGRGQGFWLGGPHHPLPHPSGYTPEQTVGLITSWLFALYPQVYMYKQWHSWKQNSSKCLLPNSVPVIH